MSRKLDPDQAADRRLTAYPQDYWDILVAISSGQGWSKRFEEHHTATAFIARFYRFRMDALQRRVAGALQLRQCIVSGTDASGKLFSANRKGTAPFLITWTALTEAPEVQAGDLSRYTAESRGEVPPPDPDPFERMMEDYIKDKPKQGE